jgi:uncharacterized repeat protein (TIGR02543 family)
MGLEEGGRKVITVKKGDKIPNFPVVTKAGYQFAGWYLDQCLTKPFSKKCPIYQNICLYAKFLKCELVQVSFECFDGTPIDPEFVCKGSPFTATQITSRDHHDFIGWYTDPEATKPFIDGSEITEDTILYASHGATIYSVTLIGCDGSLFQTITLASGSKLTNLALPPNSPHFTGWYTDADFTNPFNYSSPITSNLVLYAYCSSSTINP